MAGQTARAVIHEDRTTDRTRAGRPDTRPQEADLTYGCVDWYIYENEDQEPRHKAQRLGPLFVRS